MPLPRTTLEDKVKATLDAFDLDIRLGKPVRAAGLPGAGDPPTTDPNPDSHEYTCGSLCVSQGPGCLK
ncbi:hypothetical protein [Nocardia brasiliensis]|uniref:hypothetical protein n=1 Tax=Nocardia brasiliensis TaxID=37326 RepID=UPI00366F163C